MDILAYKFGWILLLDGLRLFPCSSEQAKEVIKILIHEIIRRFELPRSLQNDKSSAFKAAVTQGVSKALGIEYHFYTVPGDPNPQERLKKLMGILAYKFGWMLLLDGLRLFPVIVSRLRRL